MTHVIIRDARPADGNAVKRALGRRLDMEPELAGIINESLSKRGSGPYYCTVAETDKMVRAAIIWTVDSDRQVHITAFAVGHGARELAVDAMLLREEILRWEDMGVTRAAIAVPHGLVSDLMPALKDCGFTIEGMSSAWPTKSESHVHLRKHFLHRQVPRKRVMDLLKEFLISRGYETVDEKGGFRYRVHDDYHLPFIFSSWHHVTTIGPDLVMYPPVRTIEYHELENLFYPLKIVSDDERPLLLPMKKKRADTLFDLTNLHPKQKTLFDPETLGRPRRVRLHNLTYSYPVGLKTIHKGLPLLFYVNRVGAVGSARVAEWYLDDPNNLYFELEEMGHFDPEDVKEHVASSGTQEGKVLVIRFQWYKPFKRSVSLEEIRSIDRSFNPQRTHSLSQELFRDLLLAGTTTA